MTRRLSLRSEALAELTTGELTAVVGGALPTTPVDACLGGSKVVCTFECMTRGTTCAC